MIQHYKVSAYMPMTKGETFVVRDHTGAPVETWTVISSKRNDSGSGSVKMEIEGYRETSDL